jgi:DNA-3-methyladenine glycosylase II
MGRLEAFPGFPGPEQARVSNYAYLARAIVYQQLSGRAAGTIWRRVEVIGGGRVPRPALLLELPESRLRGAGVSGPKIAALRSLATAIESGELRPAGLARLTDQAVIDALVPVRGIGVWTAQMFLLFKLGRPDVLPTTDLGVQEGLRRLDGLDERPSPLEVAERGACWRPLASVAAWTLWRLAESPEA